MSPIPIKVFENRTYFASEDEVFEYAMSHPLQPRIKPDSETLKDSPLIDACWTSAEWALHFSNGKWLHLYIAERNIAYQLVDQAPECTNSTKLCRIGAAPVLVDASEFKRVKQMDPSPLVKQLVGVAPNGFIIRPGTFSVYFSNHRGLTFYAAYRTDTNENFLLVLGAN